jgi:hypothetical protein
MLPACDCTPRHSTFEAEDLTAVLHSCTRVGGCYVTHRRDHGPLNRSLSVGSAVENSGSDYGLVNFWCAVIWSAARVQSSWEPCSVSQLPNVTVTATKWHVFSALSSTNVSVQDSPMSRQFPSLELPREASSHPGNRETHRLLWYPKVHYHVHKSPPLDRILRQMNAIVRISHLCHACFISCPSCFSYFAHSNSRPFDEDHKYEAPHYTALLIRMLRTLSWAQIFFSCLVSYLNFFVSVFIPEQRFSIKNLSCLVVDLTTFSQLSW